jgi:4-amino-4-deoxy-L-arabinose transferase-like glycosyltransferase
MDTHPYKSVTNYRTKIPSLLEGIKTVTPEKSHHKSESLFVIILVALLLTLPWLDRPFHTRGEPREALVAQSMVMTNNWISPPAYNGAVPSKPPFNHWLISLVSLPGGEVTEFTSRLPSAIAVVLFSGCFYLFARRRTSERSALLAGLILLSCFEWFRGAVTCRVDTLLSTSLAGALLALFAWREKGRPGFPFLAAGLITCAALTKGPIGVALPLAIFSLFELVQGEKTIGAIVKIALRGFMIAIPVVALVSLWYIAGYLQRGDAFIEKIYYENFARLTSSMEDEPHKHAWPYMVLMLAIGLLPWTIVWITAAIRSFARRSYAITELRGRWSRATELQRFAFISATFIFVFFCIPSSKRSVYIMPAYPFIALLAAESLTAWEERSKRLQQVLGRVLVWFAVLISVVVIGGAIFLSLPQATQFGSSLLSSWSLWRIGVLAALGIMARAIIRRARQVGEPERLALSMVAAVVILNGVAAEPAFYQLSPRSWLRSSSFQGTLDLSKHERFYSFGSEAYVASFYLKKPFFSASPGLPAGSIVVVEEKNLGRLKQELASDVREVARFASGLEPTKKNLIFVEVVGSSPVPQQ